VRIIDFKELGESTSPSYSLFVCRWVAEGLLVEFQRGDVDETCVTMEALESVMWPAFFASVSAHWGLELVRKDIERDCVVYRVTKPDAKRFVTVHGLSPAVATIVEGFGEEQGK